MFRSISVGLSKFDSMNEFKDVYEISNKINLENYPFIKPFYDIRDKNNPLGNYPRYLTSPEWGEASKNYRLRFVIVSCNNDYVFIPLKVNDPPGKERTLYVSGDIISLNRDDSSIESVINSLYKIDSIKYMVEYSSEDDKYWNNYYNSLQTFMSVFNKSVWKSKHGVNKLTKCVEFKEVTYIDEKEIYNLKEVGNLWCRAKVSKGQESTSIKTDINFLKICNKVDSIHYFTFKCNDSLIGYSIGVDDSIKRRITLQSTKGLSFLNFEEFSNHVGSFNGDLRYIQKKLGSFMQYSLNSYCFNNGYEGVFYDSDMNSPGLREFKKTYYKDITFYKKVDLGASK